MPRVSGRRKNASWKSAAAHRLLRLAPAASTIPDAVTAVVTRLRDGIPCPPTDLERLAERLEVRCIRYEPLPISGELHRVTNGFEIICASSLPPGRRQFTIAHELGHAILEQAGPRCPRTGKELERLCDMLATEILMPQDVFHKVCGPQVTIPGLLQLSKTFATSLAATAIRCAELKGVSVFEIDEGRVCWAYGVIKKGPLRSLDHALILASRRALAGLSGVEEHYLTVRSNTCRWKVEYHPISRERRALFLLQKLTS